MTDSDAFENKHEYEEADRSQQSHAVPGEMTSSWTEYKNPDFVQWVVLAKPASPLESALVEGMKETIRSHIDERLLHASGQSVGSIVAPDWPYYLSSVRRGEYRREAIAEIKVRLQDMVRLADSLLAEEELHEKRKYVASILDDCKSMIVVLEEELKGVDHPERIAELKEIREMLAEVEAQFQYSLLSDVEPIPLQFDKDLIRVHTRLEMLQKRLAVKPLAEEKQKEAVDLFLRAFQTARLELRESWIIPGGSADVKADLEEKTHSEMSSLRLQDLEVNLQLVELSRKKLNAIRKQKLIGELHPVSAEMQLEELRGDIKRDMGQVRALCDELLGISLQVNPL